MRPGTMLGLASRNGLVNREDGSSSAPHGSGHDKSKGTVVVTGFPA